MKKINLFLTSLTIFTSLAISSCGGNNQEVDSKQVELTKVWLKSMQSNMSQIEIKGYEISLKQDYEVEYKDSDQYTDIEFKEHYQSIGQLKVSYHLDDSSKESADIGTILTNGEGYLFGHQQERMELYSKTTQKYKEEDNVVIEDYDYYLNHEFAIELDDQDFYTYAKEEYEDYNDTSKNQNNVFKGVVAKSLIESLSSNLISKALGEILYLSAWDDIQEFSTFTTEFYKGINPDNDEEVKNFISELNIKAEETTSSIKINFTLNTDKILKEVDPDYSGHIENINGSTLVDKSSGDILEYKYDFSKYMESLLKSLMNTRQEYNIKVNDYNIEGKIINSELDSLDIPGPFQEYTEETLEDFLNKFDTIVKPSIDDLNKIW